MKQFQLHDILCRSAKKAIGLQSDEGYFPKGHNGPWEDDDTYVRTTAHWAMAIYKAYQLTSDTTFLDSVKKALDYLIRKENRPQGASFYCRKRTTGKNQCNGLIGQVWAVEPLIFIGKEMRKSEYIAVAREVLSSHRYSFHKHAWHSKEINGADLGICGTLNQQIWFAAMVLILGKEIKDQDLLKRGIDFFENVASLVGFLDKGLIKHSFSVPKNWLGNLGRKMRNLILGAEGYGKGKEMLELMSWGYLSFLLYGFALVYENTKKDLFWENQELKRILTLSVELMDLNFPCGYLENVGFSWQYNPTGIEMAYVIDSFGNYLSIRHLKNKSADWLKKQLIGYYDFQFDLMKLNTSDPVILSSRIYEAGRIKNYTLEASEKDFIF